MNVGITGANGFIGSLLVDKCLDAGHRIHILSRNKENVDPRVTIHLGNLMDVNTLHAFVQNVEILYHCAAEIKDDLKMQAVNVEGTRNLIAAASGKIQHWVQLSSVGVYGKISSGKVTEEQPYNPNNTYEKTKLDADMLVFDAAAAKAFTFTLIRPSIVFGINMGNQSLFDLIRSIDCGYYFFIGKKGASANYVPVENVVEALYLAGTHPKALNQVYIISNWCTIEYFVNRISGSLSKAAPRFRISLKAILFLARLTVFIPKNPMTISRLNALNNRSIYSTEKIKKSLNFKSSCSVETAIDNLVVKYKMK
jgi:nucleoside-diphosphate-sugar epimerase